MDYFMYNYLKKYQISNLFLIIILLVALFLLKSKIDIHNTFSFSNLINITFVIIFTFLSIRTGNHFKILPNYSLIFGFLFLINSFLTTQINSDNFVIILTFSYLIFYTDEKNLIQYYFLGILSFIFIIFKPYILIIIITFILINALKHGLKSSTIFLVAIIITYLFYIQIKFILNQKTTLNFNLFDIELNKKFLSHYFLILITTFYFIVLLLFKYNYLDKNLKSFITFTNSMVLSSLALALFGHSNIFLANYAFLSSIFIILSIELSTKKEAFKSLLFLLYIIIIILSTITNRVS